MHHERHLVDGGAVDRLGHGLDRDIAELCHLAPHGQRYLFLGAQHQYVGLDAHLLQHLHAVLCGLGLELLGSLDIGHIGEVHAYTAVAQLPLELAHGLKKRGRLDVAHCAAYFGDYKVVFSCVGQQFHIAFYLVGDVRDDLHRFAQIVATAFLVDHTLIHSARCDVVGASRLDVGETLVVPQVQVGLVTVDGDIALAVLIGVERAWINVDVGVKLLNCHIEASREKQAGYRR